MQLFKGITVLLGVVILIVAALWQLTWGSFTPIHYRGRVVDTDGRPVSGAQVDASFAIFPYSPGRKAETTTDDEGDFQFWGMGAGIAVRASKVGYYVVPESKANIPAWVPGRPQATTNQTTTFQLRKMGECEPLLTYTLGGEIDKHGEPISFELGSGRTFKTTTPDVTLQSWVDNEGRPGTYKHFDWRFRITVPGGGLQPGPGGDFEFTAPETGYVASDEVSKSGSDPKWRASSQRDYFIKLSSGEYARMHLEYGAGGYNTYSMTYYLNPQPGHRNLEYDPSKQINK